MEQTITVLESPRYTDVYVECPHCKHAEQHPADEQRHHIQTFEILEWEQDVSGQPEVSIMKCIPCKGEFRLTWDYSKVEQVDDEDPEDEE
jgi:DNA-directed RNA polymerase subunit RPC12/RpoP